MEINPLRALGLSKIETKVYMCILSSDNLTASEIQRICSLSKPTVYLALRKLEKLNLISVASNNPRRFSVKGPESLVQLKEKIVGEIDRETVKAVELVREELEKRKHFCRETKFKTVIGGIFLESEIAIQETINLIGKAKKEIYLSGLPLWLLTKLKPYLVKAENENVAVKIAVSDEVFIPKQLKKFQAFEFIYFLPRQSVFMINGEEYDSGQIFIDRNIFANVYFRDEKLILEYIYSPRCTNCILNFEQKIAEINRCKPELQSFIPKEALIVKQAIKEGCTSKREISLRTGLSGRKVNEAITYLLEKGVITVERRVKHIGRPKTRIRLNENSTC